MYYYYFLALIDVYRAVRERRREAMHREYMQLSCLLLSCMHMYFSKKKKSCMHM